ncbi:MAG: metal-dependent hydrolase [bacterium]
MIKVHELPEKKYSIFLWCCTALAILASLSFLVSYLNGLHDAFAHADYLAGYLVLFIPVSIGLYKNSDELGQKIILFYGLLLIFWVYGVFLSSATWLSLSLGLFFMCGFLRRYDAAWSHLLFVISLFCFLLVGESIPQAGIGILLIGKRSLMWASLFDEFLHLLTALLVVFPLILSEEKLSGKVYLLAVIFLAAVLIDMDHINILLFLRTGRGIVRARTMAHSFCLGGLLSFPFWFHQDKKYGLAFVLAHFSHILRDTYTGGFVPLLWPLFPLQRYPRFLHPVGMSILLLISLGFRCRGHLIEGYYRATRKGFWIVSFVFLTGIGMTILKKKPLSLKSQALPQSAWWAQRGVLLLLALGILFLSLWFPEEKTPQPGFLCPSHYLLSGVLAGLVSGSAYALCIGILTLPYPVSLAVFGLFFLLLARCRKRGVSLPPIDF